MIILLSKSSLHDNYSSWLRRLNPGIHLSNAYTKSEPSLKKLLLRCSGIILTGGADINPSRYGKSIEINRCDGIDDKRDTLELELIDAAIKSKIPLLAICRGLQAVNIYFKGSLIVDIPDEVGIKIKHRNKTDITHEITVAKDSYLFQYGQAIKYRVNSSHHQAIGRIGGSLIPVAWSDDGLVEAVQLKKESSHFLMGVQWHPERMELSHNMSGSIGRAFLQKAAAFRS